MEGMNLNKVIKKDKEIEYKILEGETLIFVPKKGNFYRLNEVGTRIWQLIDGKRTIKEIIKRVYKEFDVSKERVESNIIEFIDKIKKKGLLS
jgi:transcription initiation factor TFIIIB Brf1 subunit/transcription initiation factor TFIIB